MANISSDINLPPLIALVGFYMTWFWPCLVTFLLERRRAPVTPGPYVAIWMVVPAALMLLIDIFSRCSLNDTSACSVFGRAAFWLMQ